MDIRGLQKLSMVDFPGKLAATVFTGGCNLRCPFCHNALLVTRLAETPRLEAGEVLAFLSRRVGMLDGVVLTGGEPLLQKDAAEFLARVKDLGYAVKLDTNGFFPEALADILGKGLADYIAMDIKNTPEKYAQTVGLPQVDLSAVEESIRLIRGSGVDYEFRTTLVKPLHAPEDMEIIGKWLEGSSRYVLQNFRNSGDLIAGSGLQGFEKLELARFSAKAEPFFGQVLLRGDSAI